jgi:hypothetical protein
MSTRYYRAEVIAWICGAILIVHERIGLIFEKEIPFLKVSLKEPGYFPHVVSAVLIVTIFYLSLEFTPKPKFRIYGRYIITLIWSGYSIWSILPVITDGTKYQGVSVVWCFWYLLSGLFIGIFTDVLLFATLMIRNSEESRRLNLPRIPFTTVGQFFTCVPLLILSLAGYYYLHSIVPPSITFIGTILTLISFMSILLIPFFCILDNLDEDGVRLPYRKSIDDLREILAVYDWNFILGCKSLSAGDLKMDPAKPFQNVQNVIREYSKSGEKKELPFRVKQLEKIHVATYAKDGDEDNFASDNCGFKITKTGGCSGSFKVVFQPLDAKTESVQLNIPIESIVIYAELFFEESCKENGHDPDIMDVYSRALNEATLDALKENKATQLHSVVNVGNISAVTVLIAGGHNVNVRGAGGWTPLLIASAHGYLDIVKILLKAGANPDIENLSMRTPLFFAAKYGRADICNELIEFGLE